MLNFGNFSGHDITSNYFRYPRNSGLPQHQQPHHFRISTMRTKSRKKSRKKHLQAIRNIILALFRTRADQTPFARRAIPTRFALARPVLAEFRATACPIRRTVAYARHKNAPLTQTARAHSRACATCACRRVTPTVRARSESAASTPRARKFASMTHTAWQVSKVTQISPNLTLKSLKKDETNISKFQKIH